MPIVTALLYGGEDLWVFIVSMVVTAGFGLLLRRLDPDPTPGAREAFFVVAFTWLFASIFGALPYILAGTGAIAHPINALFESMSGFTTTGATVMETISVEEHSHAIMLCDSSHSGSAGWESLSSPSQSSHSLPSVARN